MNLQHELATIQATIPKQIFTDELLSKLLLVYHQEVRQKNLPVVEDDCKKGRKALERILNDVQKGALYNIETSFYNNLKWAMSFGFSRGVYVGFQEAFLRAAWTDPFQNLVVNELLITPNMQRYPDYVRERNYCQELYDLLYAQLDSDAQKHLASILCAWDERLHSVLWNAFHMGRQQARALFAEVHPIYLEKNKEK